MLFRCDRICAGRAATRPTYALKMPLFYLLQFRSTHEHSLHSTPEPSFDITLRIRLGLPAFVKAVRHAGHRST